MNPLDTFRSLAPKISLYMHATVATRGQRRGLIYNLHLILTAVIRKEGDAADALDPSDGHVVARWRKFVTICRVQANRRVGHFDPRAGSMVEEINEDGRVLAEVLVAAVVARGWRDVVRVVNVFWESGAAGEGAKEGKEGR